MISLRNGQRTRRPTLHVYITLHVPIITLHSCTKYSLCPATFSQFAMKSPLSDGGISIESDAKPKNAGEFESVTWSGAGFTMLNVESYNHGTLPSQVPIRKMEHESIAKINSLLIDCSN